MILYRPVGLQELALIYDSGMQSFPARLPQQPIFYPVLQLEYARHTASDWNARHEQFAGYVTEFRVEDEYISKFETHTVGDSQHQELWITAEEIEEFNMHIVGHIKVLEAYFGEAFQGFVPEQFGLQRKNAVEQFTQLANSYLYKRMDFYLEIKRNHKAVFLNYPYWQTYEFKNPGMKEKILQAIKEAWLTSFPKIPLPNPVPRDIQPAEQTEPRGQSPGNAVHNDITPVEHIWSDTLDEEIPPVKRTYTPAQHLAEPVEEDAFDEQTEADSFDDPLEEDVTPRRQIHTPPLNNRAQEEIRSAAQSDVRAPVQQETRLPTQPNPHFVQGIKLGLSEKYHEAIAELSRAVEKDPDHVAAHASLGVAFHRLSEDDRALACYETALKIDPIYAEAHYFRANLLYSRGKIREAIASYTVAIGLQPELIEAHLQPSPEDRLTDYSGSPAEIHRIAKPAYRILELNKLFEAHPEHASLFKERAAEYCRLRNYAQAIADYTSLLALQPEDASALHSRGVAYEQLGQADRALEDYQQAIAIDPQLWNVYINRGVALGQMGNLRQSIASLTEAIRLAPQNPDGYFNRGNVYFQLGDFERAIADFSRVIQLSSEDEEAYYWRGSSNEQAGRQEQAIADYRQFLALSQDENARREIEQKLSRWSEGNQESVNDRGAVRQDRQAPNQVPPTKPERDFDLYDLLMALGERALHSIWFGSDVKCYGEKAKELYTFANQDRPIEGRDLFQIAAGIRQTTEGDFQAFDPGANTPWIFLRAWKGSGFYVEIDDPQLEKQLKANFQAVEEVEGVSPPYAGLFIHV